MFKKEKGMYGYAREYRNKKMILAGIFLVLILASVIAGFLIYKTRLTVFSVIACLLSLPFAKLFIGFLVSLKFTPMTPSEYDKIKSGAEDKTSGKVSFFYDIPLNDTEHHYFIQAFAVRDKRVVCFIKDKTDAAICKKMISDRLLADKEIKDLCPEVRVCSDINDFIKITCNLAGDVPKDSEGETEENDNVAADMSEKIKNKIFCMGI